MVFQQAQRHRLQRPGHRGHLSQDVDAVLVVLDHLLQPADLTLDPAQPLEVVLFVRGVSVHAVLRPAALPRPPARYHPAYLTLAGYQPDGPATFLPGRSNLIPVEGIPRWS